MSDSVRSARLAHVELALAPCPWRLLRRLPGRARIRHHEGRRETALHERDFNELPVSAILRLTDEQLLDYIASARAAGASDAATDGVRHLIWRHVDSVRARVHLKFPPYMVDDVTHDILVEAVASAFDGRTVKQFFAWLNTVVANQIADFWRGKKGRQLELDKKGGIVSDDDDDDGLSARRGEPTAEDQDGLLELQDIIDSLLAELSDKHREVVDLYVFGAFTAKEVERQTGEKDSNVHQIGKRFRDRLRARLEEAERDRSDTDETP